MVVAQHSTRLISVRIQEPLADQVIIADVPTTQPIRQFSGDAIEISDSENQGKKKMRDEIQKLRLSLEKVSSTSPLKKGGKKLRIGGKKLVPNPPGQVCSNLRKRRLKKAWQGSMY